MDFRVGSEPFAEAGKSRLLQLPNPLAGQSNMASNLLERQRCLAMEPEPHRENATRKGFKKAQEQLHLAEVIPLFHNVIASGV